MHDKFPYHKFSSPLWLGGWAACGFLIANKLFNLIGGPFPGNVIAAVASLLLALISGAVLIGAIGYIVHEALARRDKEHFNIEQNATTEETAPE